MKNLIRKKKSSHLTARYAQKIRDGEIKFTKQKSAKCTNGLCFFCGKTKSFNKSQWQLHLISHTNENFFFCYECGQNFSKRKGHPCSNDSIENIYQRNDCSGDGYLAAFVCKVCNYVRVNESKMRAHLRKEHADLYDDPEDVLSLYEKCKFVKNL